MKRTNVEGQFLCGLLHTIGKPVLMQILAGLKKDIGVALTNEDALILVEEFHGGLGKRLAESWKLPLQLQVCCEYYTRYQEVPSFTDETAMIYLADRLGHWTLAPESLDESELMQEPVFDTLNFYPDERETLLGRQPDVLEAVQAMDL